MIPVEFKETTKILDEFIEFARVLPPDVPSEPEFHINKKTGKNWGTELTQSFAKEYKSLSEKGKYFTGCPFSIYQNHYQQRLSKFLEDKIDVLEIDFILNDYILLNEDKVEYYSPDELREQIKASFRRTKEFLQDSVNQLGYKLVKTKDDYNNLKFYYVKNTISSNETELIDLSDTNLSQKIIYLELLGVIEFVRSKYKYGVSNNQIASVLSAITGEKPQSIQSALNPINNREVSQKNNPFSNEKSVEKIRLKLIELGVELPD
ncbi:MULTISPECIES: hypothetical protein [unclassified Myroides]|uniref:hypothetical protein n=1 Tax=unclassified Myroides TaxID=2642485 RepID=UPI003D2F86CD